jgi:hypothetical protein
LRKLWYIIQAISLYISSLSSKLFIDLSLSHPEDIYFLWKYTIIELDPCVYLFEVGLGVGIEYSCNYNA